MSGLQRVRHNCADGRSGRVPSKEFRSPLRKETPVNVQMVASTAAPAPLVLHNHLRPKVEPATGGPKPKGALKMTTTSSPPHHITLNDLELSMHADGPCFLEQSHPMHTEADCIPRVSCSPASAPERAPPAAQPTEAEQPCMIKNVHLDRAMLDSDEFKRAALANMSVTREWNYFMYGHMRHEREARLHPQQK